MSNPEPKKDNEKFCHECGEIIRNNAVVCPKCGIKQGSIPKDATSKYCFECGESIRVNAEICPKCGIRQKRSTSGSLSANNKSKNVAAALALVNFIFPFIPGSHHFYLGNTKAGIIYLLLFYPGAIFVGCPTVAIWIICIVEGFLYLAMNEEDFNYRVENLQTSIFSSLINKD